MTTLECGLKSPSQSSLGSVCNSNNWGYKSSKQVWRHTKAAQTEKYYQQAVSVPTSEMKSFSNNLTSNLTPGEDSAT